MFSNYWLHCIVVQPLGATVLDNVDNVVLVSLCPIKWKQL